MSKLIAYAITALFITAPSLAIAQTPRPLQEAQSRRGGS